MFIQDTEERTGKFITFSDGKLKMKVEEGTQGAKSRINKLGNQVWEVTFRGITNCELSGVKVEEGPYGWQIILDLKDPTQTVHLAISEESAYGRAMYSLFEKIDPKKKLEIHPYSFVNDEGKKFTGFNIKQDGVKLEKSVPQGTPLVESKEIKGKWVYNQIQQAERAQYLRDKLIVWAKSMGLDKADLGPNVDTTELSTDEIKELKKLKKSGKAEVSNSDLDDFFESM